jgi:hypothetical protein
MNVPFHSNWVGLLELINQLVIGKQHVHLIPQTTLLEKTLEKIRETSTLNFWKPSM